MEERKEIVTKYKKMGLSVSKSVGLASISRSSYYYSPKDGKPGRKPSTITELVTGESVCNKELVWLIKELLGLEFVDYGYLKVTHWLNQHGFLISDDKVYRLMKENNLLNPRQKKSHDKKYVKYTLALPKAPLELLEMDIKYIYVHGSGQNALVLTIIDTFTREALEHICQYSIKKNDVKKLVERLVVEHLQPNDLINRDIRVTIRSDNGSQFIAKIVKQCMRDNFIVQEFTYPATPQQNAHIESFHSILKRLVQEKYEFTDIRHLKKVLNAFYWFYNEVRLHSSTCYLAPKVFEWAWENDYIRIKDGEKVQRKRFSLTQLPVNIVDQYNSIIFASSSEAETSSAGEQLVRNSLMKRNGTGEFNSSPESLKTISGLNALKNSLSNLKTVQLNTG